MNTPQNSEKLRELLLSSINQPSGADIKVAIIRPHNGTTVFREFQDVEDTIDLVTFTKTLDTKKPDEASVDIFIKNGRPNARRLVILLVNGTALPSDELITQWNRTFVDNDVLVIPVVFGRQDDGEKLLPIASKSGVQTMEPEDDPAKKGEKIAQEITRGKFVNYVFRFFIRVQRHKLTLVLTILDPCFVLSCDDSQLCKQGMCGKHDY